MSLSGSRSYDGTTTLSSGIFSLGNRVSGETLTLSGSGSMADKHVGTGKAVTAGTLALGSGTGTATDYTLTGGTHVVTIATAPLTLTTSAVTKTYDGTKSASSTATVASGSLFGSDSLSGGSFAFTDPNAGSSNKTVTVSSLTVNDGNSGNNYTVSYQSNTTSTINKAHLTVTADNQTRTYGAANPTFTQTISGYVNGENATTAGLTGSATGSSAATGTSNVGSYAITGSTGTLAAANYDFTPANGTLSITQAPLTVTASNGIKTYGDTKTFAGTEFTSSGLQNSETIGGVTLASTGAAATANVAGTPYAIAASNATGGGFTAGNYNIAYVNGLLTINPAPLTVAANNASKTENGTPYSGGNGVIYSGFVNGETSAVLGGTLGYSGSSQGAVNAGSYVITPGSLTSGNYTISYVDGSLTISSPTPTPPVISGNTTSNNGVGSPTTQGTAGTSPFSPPSVLATSSDTATSTGVGGVGGSNPSSGDSTSSSPNPSSSSGASSGSTGSIPATSTASSGMLNVGGVDGGLSVSFGFSGGAAILSLSGSGESATSENVSGASQSSGAARSSSILLLTQGADGLSAAGTMTVVDQGQTLRSTPSSGEVASLPQFSREGMRSVTVDYTLPTGAQQEVTVGISPQGALVITIPPGVRETLDERHIVLIGIAIAKERLGVKLENVKGVMIEAK